MERRDGAGKETGGPTREMGAERESLESSGPDRVNDVDGRDWKEDKGQSEEGSADSWWTIRGIDAPMKDDRAGG